VLTQQVVFLDAVLERYDCHPALRQRPQARGNLFGIPEFHRNDHEIDLADVRNRFDGVGLDDMSIAKRTGKAQSMAANCIQMRAARDEGDFAASRGQATANAARSQNCNSHWVVERNRFHEFCPFLFRCLLLGDQ
jgi:hypothetical protein